MKTLPDIALNALEAAEEAAKGFQAVTQAETLSEAKSLAYRSMAVMRRTLTREDT